MADKTIPQLDPVVTPAPTDRFGVRQAGDIEDKRETREQVHALEDGEYLVNSFTNNITANPGGGQVGATGLTSETNLVTACEDAGDGIRLPATFPVGAIVEVHVRGTTDSPDLWPAVGDDLGEGVDTALRLAPNQQVRFIATVADSTWVRLFQELIQSEALSGAIIEPNIGGASNSPSLIPDKRDRDTGIAGNGVDTLFLIANNLNIASFAAAGGQIKQTWRMDTTVTANPGGGQVGAVELLATWQFVNVVATTGDSVRLPGTFQPGTLIWAKNTGANACDVFPASGDDLGAGVDTAVSLAAGDSTQFIGSVANSIWEQEQPGHVSLTLTEAPGALEATPTLAFGDGDTGFFESADDVLNKSIAGAIQAITGPDGQLFINTLTGPVDFQGGNIISATPAKISIFGARTATNGVDGGAVEIWGGYAAGVSGFPEGGRVGIWGGGGGGGEASGGNIEMFGGEADALPGDIILTGGVATVSGSGGSSQLLGGVGFGGNSQGGMAVVTGGAAVGTGQGADVRVTAGASGPGATGTGGVARLTAGASLATNGPGGQVVITAGLGAGTGAGGALSITGGKAGTGGAGIGGAVTITAGEAGAGGSGAGGVLTLSGGDSVSTGDGGAANLLGGLGHFNDSGGAVNVTGGDSGASGTGGAGGVATIEGGAALGTNGDGGDVNLTGGLGNGSGTDGVINITGLVTGFSFNANLLADTATGPAIVDEAASAGNPTLIPVRNDLTTGIGGAGLTSLSLIAGGVEGIRLVQASGDVLQQHNSNVGLTADVSSVQGGGVITSSYNVYSVVGTAGDAATLPAVFVAGSVVYVKNDDATESMDVFPALGDDAGAGTNTAVAVLAGDFAVFLGTVANSTWTKIMGGAA
jgi:hypothetical protein